MHFHFHVADQSFLCSGMLVQDPSKANDVDAIFNQARQYLVVERLQNTFHLQAQGALLELQDNL